jgi:hypothetical protein
MNYNVFSWLVGLVLQGLWGRLDPRALLEPQGLPARHLSTIYSLEQALDNQQQGFRLGST